MTQYLCSMYYFDWAFVGIVSKSDEKEAKRTSSLLCKRKTGFDVTEHITVRVLDDLKLNKIYEV